MPLESTLAKIPPPDRRILKAFRHSFFHDQPGSGGAFPILGENSRFLYDDPDDLVALHASDQRDRLAVFVFDKFGFFFKVLHSFFLKFQLRSI